MFQGKEKHRILDTSEMYTCVTQPARTTNGCNVLIIIIVIIIYRQFVPSFVFVVAIATAITATFAFAVIVDRTQLLLFLLNAKSERSKFDGMSTRI